MKNSWKHRWFCFRSNVISDTWFSEVDSWVGFRRDSQTTIQKVTSHLRWQTWTSARRGRTPARGRGGCVATRLGGSTAGANTLTTWSKDTAYEVNVRLTYNCVLVLETCCQLTKQTPFLCFLGDLMRLRCLLWESCDVMRTGFEIWFLHAEFSKQTTVQISQLGKHPFCTFQAISSFVGGCRSGGWNCGTPRTLSTFPERYSTKEQLHSGKSRRKWSTRWLNLFLWWARSHETRSRAKGTIVLLHRATGCWATSTASASSLTRTSLRSSWPLSVMLALQRVSDKFFHRIRRSTEMRHKWIRDPCFCGWKLDGQEIVKTFHCRLKRCSWRFRLRLVRPMSCESREWLPCKPTLSRLMSHS